MEVSKESQIIKSYFDNEKFNHQSKHILLELYKCDFDKLNDESFLRCSLNKAAKLIKEICGGEISKIDVQKIETYKTKKISFDR